MVPFCNNYVIDYESLDKLINKTLNSSVTGVVILGTTSEAPTLNYDEKVYLTKYIRNKISGIKKVMVGIGGNNTQDTLSFAQEIRYYCDYMLVTVPNYNKPTQSGIKAHFEYICNNNDLINKPFMLYNVPSRCGVNMTPETVSDVFNSCNNACAIKEASGSISQSISIRSLCDIQIFSGDDGLVVPIMSIGGSGLISVVSNILPNEINRVYELCKSNDYKNATSEYLKLNEICKNLFIETNPVPGKELLKHIGVFKTSTPRLPLVKMSPENKEKLIISYDKFRNVDDVLHQI